jgi:uncharacterized Rmd1/YagE family protein
MTTGPEASLRCVSYATAVTYPVKELARAFRETHSVSMFRDVVFVSFKDISEDDERGVFLFPYGAAVMWSLTVDEEVSALAVIRSLEEGSYDTREKETMGYSYGKTSAIIDDEIVLPSNDLSIKLAFSHGLAQSVKLSSFERIVKKTISTTRAIPEQLARYGSIPLSRKEIRRKMGDLFIERSSINLHFDVLDVPEYFWENPDLEPFYTIIATHLELETRVEILNHRLDVIHDLFEMLGNELHHQHSNRLEWIIILLIVIEVVISLLREFS